MGEKSHGENGQQTSLVTTSSQPGFPHTESSPRDTGADEEEDDDNATPRVSGATFFKGHNQQDRTSERQDDSQKVDLTKVRCFELGS